MQEGDEPTLLYKLVRTNCSMKCLSRADGDSARPRMGTREVYEEKLRSGNLHHDPTMNPGLGSPRCPRCLYLLDHDSDKGKGEWTITAVLHDATGVAGFGIGGMLGAIHGFNMGIPYLQNCLKGPNWHPFLLGFPPLLLFSGASAAFGGYALPKFESWLNSLWLRIK